MKIYIPIGSNCSVARFLRNKNIRTLAFPFDWICTPLKIVYKILLNNFDSFIEDVFIGERIYRLYSEENELEESKRVNDFIYPVICKNYLTLLPHDYKTIDDVSLVNVKNKYKRRIERFNHYINRSDIEIVLIYSNINYYLNEWQLSVYNKFKIDVSDLQKDNMFYINKIKELYKDKRNIKIISLEEMNNI